MLTILWCILQNCSREGRLSHTRSAKHPCHSAKSRQPTADGKQDFTIFPFCSWRLVCFLFCFVSFFFKKRREVVMASCSTKRRADACIPCIRTRARLAVQTCHGVPSLCHLSDHPSVCQRPHHAVPQYFWVKPLQHHVSQLHHSCELLPLYSPPPPPQEGLLHATASMSEGSFTPRASQEWHVCQEIWCQYLPGALQSQLHTEPGQLPSLLPRHPHAPV